MSLVENEFLFYSIEAERKYDCVQASLTKRIITDEDEIDNIFNLVDRVSRNALRENIVI
mgnify:CR=1 FL=1